MNLSPVEAIKRVNESVTVEMLVQRTKCCTGSSQVFLDSEADSAKAYLSKRAASVTHSALAVSDERLVTASV